MNFNFPLPEKMICIFIHSLRPAAILFCCFGLIGFSSAQEQLKGILTDWDDSTAIEFASVYIPETVYYTETDSEGKFTLLIPDQKSFILKCSRLGYNPLELNVRQKDVKNKSLLVLKMKKIISKEVEVKSSVADRESGVREQVEEFALLPSVSGAIESVLPSIALGVRSSAGGEFSSQYSVRGGSYDENLVYVNGFEVFRPQLIRSGQQEGLSFPNPDLIRDLKFFSGGFEAKYGDKLSSVLDIRYKIPDSLKASVVLSALGGSMHLEGGLGTERKPKAIRYLMGLRYKTTKYLLNSLDVEGEYQPRFLDIQSFVSWDIAPEFKLSWIGNINSSVYELFPESSSVAKGSFFQVLNLNTAFEGSETDVFQHYMTGLGLSYIPLNPRHNYFIQLNTAFYKAYEAEQFDILGYYRLVEVEAGNLDEDAKEVKLWGEGTQHLYTRNYLYKNIQHYELKGAVEFKGPASGKGHFFQWGTFLRREFFEDKINEWERLDSAGFSLPYIEDSLVLNAVLKSKNEFENTKWAGWIQDEWSVELNDRHLLKIIAGIRAHYSSLNDEWITNPRIKLEWIPLEHKNQFQLWISGGLYHQVPFYREYRQPDGILNFNLKSQKSLHLVLGLQKQLNLSKIGPKPIKWISEIYYKKLWDVVSYELENVRIRYSGQNDAEAYAVGWDNRINGEFVPGAESWVSLSFLRTYEKLNGVQHKRREPGNSEPLNVGSVPRPTDQFFALGIFFQDYLPQNKNCKMHTQIQVATGLPYGLKGNNIEFRNEQRLKAYHRVDIGFSFLLWDKDRKERNPGHWLKFCRQAWISAEVYNLLKVKNEASVNWIKTLYNYQFAIPTYLSSRRINLKLRIDF